MARTAAAFDVRWALILSIVMLGFVMANIYYQMGWIKEDDFIKSRQQFHPLIRLHNDLGKYPQHHYARHPIIAYPLHILPALVWSITAPLQLWPAFRTRFPFWHRWSGRLMLCMSFLLGCSGILMVFYDMTFSQPTFSFHRGIIPSANLLVYCMSIPFLFTGYKLYQAARLKKFKLEHPKWATRHLAIGYSVSLMRVYLIIEASLLGALFPTKEPISFEYRTANFAASWVAAYITLLYLTERRLFRTAIAIKKQ